MERLIDQSIRMGPLKRFPLERSQHAYQRVRSSETASHDLVIRIESALRYKEILYLTEVYAILACSDYSRSANMHNMAICMF
jgi:hypothetical protein